MQIVSQEKNENAAMFALGKAGTGVPGQNTLHRYRQAHNNRRVYDAIKGSRNTGRPIAVSDILNSSEGLKQKRKHACTEIKKTEIVITGGLGGIGLEVAKHLAEKASVRLGLVNRTKMPKRSLWDEMLLKGEDEKVCRRIKAVKEIEAKGSMVECLSADVSSLDQMKQIMEALRQKYGRIDGVIHAAGVAGDGFIRKDENIQQRNMSKIHGTWVLDHVTRRIN